MGEAQSKFALCPTCAERQDERFMPTPASGDCFICNGLSSKVNFYAKKIVNVTRHYEFQTFSIGLILPPRVQDREDQLRSEYKIRGGETIKSQISRIIAGVVARTMKKRLDRLHPDLTILVDTNQSAIDVGSRSLFVHCRYTKPRGVAQRKRFCSRCSGKGCERCGNSGYETAPSVEEALEGRLRKLLGASKMKFTWLGTEDEDSVVYPPGRPFVVEVKNPRRRGVPRRMFLRTGGGVAKITRLGILAGRPVQLPSFVLKTKTVMKAAREISESDLRMMSERLKDVVVRYRNNKGRVVLKKVHSVRVQRRGKTITADITLDGGLPIKRLISGESVSPSLSEIAKTPLKCERFDIMRVETSGQFKIGG